MTRPNRKPTQNEGGGVLTRFAADLGCIGGVDAIPPHQYKSEQDRRYTLDRRVLAWLRAHTLPYRSHFAVDAKGKALTLKHAAAHLDIEDLPRMHHIWRELEKEGRVYRGTGEPKILATLNGRQVTAAPAPGGSLCLSGYFEMQPLFVQTNDSTRKQRDLTFLTPELRAEFIAEEERDQEIYRLVHKRQLAALRFFIDQRENSRCARYAVKCPRASKYGTEEEQAKRRSAVQDLLPSVEKFVQTIEGEPLYKLSTDFVPTIGEPVNGHANGPQNGTYKSAPSVLSDFSPEKRSDFPADLGSQCKKEKPACLPEARQADRPSSLSNEKTEELRAMLVRWLGNKLPDQVPGNKLLADVTAALAPATLPDLAQRVQKRMESIQSYGMVLQLARDCAVLARTAANGHGNHEACPKCQAPRRIDGGLWRCANGHAGSVEAGGAA